MTSLMIESLEAPYRQDDGRAAASSTPKA